MPIYRVYVDMRYCELDHNAIVFEASSEAEARQTIQDALDSGRWTELAAPDFLWQDEEEPEETDEGEVTGVELEQVFLQEAPWERFQASVRRHRERAR